MKKPIYKRWWFLALILFLIIIIWAAAGGLGSEPPISEKDNTEEDDTTIPEGTDTQEKMEQDGKDNAARKDTGDKPQIEFKNILVKTTMGMSNVYGEVVNNDDQAHSFTVKVSFYDSNNKLLGSAVGAVNDLNGGSTKTFTAVATEDYSQAASHKAQVDTMVSTKANIKDVINFSNIVVKSNFGTTTVEGEAKNTDNKEHSFTVVVSFYDENKKLIGVVSGAVNDLAAGETKTFSALSIDDMSGAASHKVQVDTMVE